MGEIFRLIVAVLVAAVFVWLLGSVAGLPGLIVGLIALLAFLAVVWPILDAAIPSSYRRR